VSLFTLDILCRYHIFRQAHLIGPVFVAAAAYHAFSSWYYLAPPALLWLFDRMLRLYRAATSLSPNRVSRHGIGQEGTVAVIEFSAVSHEAGQYGYLVCPHISPDNWHPFTIASSPCDSVTTLVVKDMGSGTWTHQLHECENLQTFYPAFLLCFPEPIALGT
jgi:predicted ferric reductase